MFFFIHFFVVFCLQLVYPIITELLTASYKYCIGSGRRASFMRMRELHLFVEMFVEVAKHDDHLQNMKKLKK